MHTQDRNVLYPLFFQVTLLTALAVSPGCDGKSAAISTVYADAGKDAPNSDSARSPDTSLPDQAFTDMSKPETSPDSVDAPARDGTTGDHPALTDAPAGIDGRVDAGSVDSNLIDSSPNDAQVTLSTSQAHLTFVFKNTGTQAVYLQMECALQFQVVSEVTSTVYPNKSICLCQCADPICLDTPSCPPCAARSGIAVESGKTFETTWVAETSTMRDKTGTRGAFKCLDYSPIPTGAYRVSIPVFPTAADAAANTNASSASLPFQLTVADAKFEVPLR